MPVEIKELVIRAVASQEDAPADTLSQEERTGTRREELIQACVREVLEILRKEKER